MSKVTATGKSAWKYAKYLALKEVARACVALHKLRESLKRGLKSICSSTAIYRPAGAAAEYSKVAAGFYVGCPNGCIYCYLKIGPTSGTLGGSIVKLKKGLKSEADAVEIFFNELFGGTGGVVRPEILRDGLFFTFTTDPGLPETFHLFAAVIAETVKLHVPIHFLTKMTGWMESDIWEDLLSIPETKEYLAIGFTLTGRDDLEQKASPNKERLVALRRLHDEGFRTFTSIEPVIDIEASLSIVKECIGVVDLFKVGLESHRKYDKEEVLRFVGDLAALPEKPCIYLKDSIIDLIGRERDSFGENFVDANFRP
ncbi:MAG: hypothetical protein IKW89_02485 [Bacteroidales bacterium]|nr:hypothetical protein [Bacteroidales bacterium]